MIKRKKLGPASGGENLQVAAIDLNVSIELTAIEYLNAKSRLGGVKLPAHSYGDCFLCGWIQHAFRCPSYAPRGPLEEAGWLAREISSEDESMGS
jgi:hypothetical protein